MKDQNYYQDKIITIPNLLSVFRILLIPLILWLYMVKQAYLWSVAVILFSGFTDIVDGFIARRFHMISNVGKVLDPVADKLTQCALLVCLISRYSWMWIPVAFFVVKELVQGVLGYIAMKKLQGKAYGAFWYGKASTVTLYLSMAVLFFFPSFPEMGAKILCALCCCMLTLALALYLRYDIKLLKQ